MAKKDKEYSVNIIGRMINTVSNNINNIYKGTYNNQIDNKNQLDNIKQDLSTSIDKITNSNYENIGEPNISRLYTRIRKEGNSEQKKFGNSIESMFNDRNITDTLLMGNFVDNKAIKDYDEEIDLICRFMPQLQQALDLKKDNVLSADHYAKDFINVVNNSCSDNEAIFCERTRELKQKYNLIEVFEDMYDRAAKYGECFVYVVPYNKTLSQLMYDKDSKCVITPGFYSESFEVSTYVQENMFDMDINISDKKIVLENQVSPEFPFDDNFLNNCSIGNVHFEFNRSGVMESTVKQKAAMNKFTDNQYSKFVTNMFKSGGQKKELESPEGVVDYETLKKKETEINVPGCVLKILDREKVIPIYIDTICMGYYYIEFDLNDMETSQFTSSMFGKGKFNDITRHVMKNNNEKMLMFISGQLSRFIDRNFIQNNQDLTKEIYMILKNNDDIYNKKNLNIRASYIPPEDIEHFYFKKDPKTNRGISDLDLAIVPAKYYAALNMTNTIGMMTRGQDKRMYYVKQNIDTNISQTLLNTINQIKKSNFGSRELANIKNTMNIVGRFNDYVIPVGGSGDPPITFEVMPGQDIDPKTDFLQQLEEMAISATDMPYDYVQGRNTTDFATRLTMSNGKFMRLTFKRQAICNSSFSRIYNKLYNSEYNLDSPHEDISVLLPPPAFLAANSTSQMMQLVVDEVNNIVEMEMANEQDEAIKNNFRKLLLRHYLSSYLDLEMVDKLYKKAKLESALEQNETEEQ